MRLSNQKRFLDEVKAHLMDRTSQREELSYFEHDIHKHPNKSIVMENMPELSGINRDFLPGDTYVIVAYYKDQRHLEWILNNHWYNFRAGLDNGSIALDNEIINARCVLLYNDKEATYLIRIKKRGLWFTPAHN